MLSLGALNKKTNKYVHPFEANKKDQYICPDCNKDLIIRKGDIKIHHFANCKFCCNEIDISELLVINDNKYHKNCYNEIELLIKEIKKNISTSYCSQTKCCLCNFSLVKNISDIININTNTTESISRIFFIKLKNKLFHKQCYNNFKLDDKCCICSLKINITNYFTKSNKKYHKLCFDSIKLCISCNEEINLSSCIIDDKYCIKCKKIICTYCNKKILDDKFIIHNKNFYYHNECMDKINKITKYT
jgi:competence CoiA-like predicted nuclease